jgi:DNA sulfur modification protein DndD
MILEQLTLRNFCLYRGEQTFSLVPGQRSGKHLPIILFGGINGGGKTTLLDAIQLALYGGRAKCSKRSSLAYDDFLRESIHHGLNGGEHAGVSLAFRYATDGEERLYDVSRTWKISDGRVREDLRVSQDGVLDQWLSDNWPQLVEELFPLDISQLFFFDAEKIRSLAEDESSSKALGAAIKSLLGLDIVERLITDSTVVQSRLARRAGTPEQQTQVESLERLLREHQTRLNSLVTERAALENQRLRAEIELKTAEEAFASSGGKHWEARQDRNRRLGEVTSLEESIKSQLVTIAAGDLPMTLVGDLLRSVGQRDDEERQAFDAELIRRLLEERDKELLMVVRSAKGSASLIKRLSEHLAADRAERRPQSSAPELLNLSEASRTLLRHLHGQRLEAHRDEARQLLERLARVTQEREDLDRSIEATPDETDISAVVARFKDVTGILAQLNQQAVQLDAAVGAERDKVEECEDKLEKLWQGKIDKEFAQEDVRRMMDLVGRTRETMQVFLQRVTASKIDRLSALITESFRFLLRKQSLVERIIINPGTFTITLYDQSGQAVAKQRLSEGEKQIFAVSVLWGLARASSRPLPAVIDTPMARLDATHRQHMVERYFPNASHQVVIFSTDTEVDRKYYKGLQPHIARAYSLNYDERTKRTVGEEGYFWKE